MISANQPRRDERLLGRAQRNPALLLRTCLGHCEHSNPCIRATNQHLKASQVRDAVLPGLLFTGTGCNLFQIQCQAADAEFKFFADMGIMPLVGRLAIREYRNALRSR